MTGENKEFQGFLPLTPSVTGILVFVVTGTRHITGKGKLIFPGAASLFIGFYIISVEKGQRLQAILDGAWVLWCFLIILFAYFLCLGIRKSRSGNSN